MPNSTTPLPQHQQKSKQALRILQLKRPQQQKFKQWQQQHQWLVVSVVMLTLFTIAIEGITEELSPDQYWTYPTAINVIAILKAVTMTFLIVITIITFFSSFLFTCGIHLH